MTVDHFARSTIDLVQRFFAWWGAELAACLPQFLRLEQSWARRDLVLLLGPREAVLGQDKADGGFEALERLGPGQRRGGIGPRERASPVRLRLGADAALRLIIELPEAALENLNEAVAFQLDRYTPFTPAQVHLACETVERDAVGGRVSVATTLVERRTVEDALAAAERLGVTVVAIEVARGDARERAADRLPVPGIRARSRSQRTLVAASAALLLALVAASVALPFAHERLRADALTRSLAAARRQAEAAQALEKAIDAQRREADFLVDRKRDRPSALAILAELTRLAPDDTWLASVQFSGTQLQLTGISRSASGLIGLFEKSALFRDAEFRSPVTPDPATGREHFVISAQVGTGTAR